MRVFACTATGAAALALALTAAAQQPIIYPAKGQSAQQQQKDQGECQVWATNTTGIDPVALAQAPSPESGSTFGGGERVQGAARGALGGLAIIAGPPGADELTKAEKREDVRRMTP